VRVIRYLTAGVKHAFGLYRPGRTVPVRPDDILLASYPNSGNTWMRFLIANLVHPDREVSYGNLHQLVFDPDVSVKRDFDRAPRPRIVKTHGSFDPRYRRVIYLVRDPRDVALAQYQRLRQLRSIGDEFSLDNFIERFLAGGDAVSLVSTDHFGSWGENAGSWLAASFRHPGLLLLRYEDLLADAARELTRVAEFAGLPETTERISQAVARSAPDKITDSEKEQGRDVPLVPSAKSGGWRSDLPKPLVARIEAAWGDIMACLGYELVTRDSHSALESSLLGLLAVGAAGSTGEQREEALVGDTSERAGLSAERTTAR
jgi:hypothetical protein